MVVDLVDDTYNCLQPPYNIEASFCQAPRNPSVQMKLAHANCTALKRQTEGEAPYFLWGDKGPNVLPNTKPLPDGSYYLYTKADGVTYRIRFDQCCDDCQGDPYSEKCSLTI
jgi:hypothetical protein